MTHHRIERAGRAARAYVREQARGDDDVDLERAGGIRIGGGHVRDARQVEHRVGHGGIDRVARRVGARRSPSHQCTASLASESSAPGGGASPDACPTHPTRLQQLTTQPLAGEAGRAGHQRAHVSSAPGVARDPLRPSSR